MRSLLKNKLLIVTMLLIVGFLVACEEESEAERSERQVKTDNYNRLTKEEPAKEVTNPKTRETINFFTETWNKKDQLAYVYLQNSEGKMIGYYVLDGAPVSMCTSITQDYEIKHSNSEGRVVVPAPAIDGVYRGNEDCSRYYGKDATTGAYIEFTTGMGINMLLYTEPLENTGAINLAPSGDKKDK